MQTVVEDAPRLFDDPAFRRRRIIMTGGKGGVGKTTCAAAIALRFAEEGTPTLVLSSDPTPSLSDIFETDIGGAVGPVAGIANLYGLELSYTAVQRMWRERFGDEVYAVLSSFLPVGPEILDYIVEAPGFVDEQFMLAYILDLYREGRFDKIIWDTAPAGQTLSLLRLESRFYDHLTEAAHLYTRLRTTFDRLRALARPGDHRSALDIIEVWRQLAEVILATLRDHEITEFIPVTVPEALGVYQTARLIAELDAYGIGVSRIVVNNVLPEAECTTPYLASRLAVQRRNLELLRQRHAATHSLVSVPLLAGEVKGIAALRQIYAYM